MNFKTLWTAACAYWVAMYTRLSGIQVEKAENVVLSLLKDKGLQDAVKEFISTASVQLAVIKLGIAAKAMKEEFMELVEGMEENNKSLEKAGENPEKMEIVIAAKDFWNKIKP